MTDRAMSEALRLAVAITQHGVRYGHETEEQAKMRRINAADEAAAELRRLHAENEALRADAERYRWLRENGRIGFSGAPHWNVSVSFYSVDSDLQTLDKNIDAARKEST